MNDRDAEQGTVTGRRSAPLAKKVFDGMDALRMNILEKLIEFQGAEGGEDGERIRQALWAAARLIDTALDDDQTAAGLDLSRDDEATRQRLQAITEWRYFTPHPLGDPGDFHVPAHTSEACELRVFHDFGRWLATWKRLDSGLGKSTELLVITAAADGRIVFADV